MAIIGVPGIGLADTLANRGRPWAHYGIHRLQTKHCCSPLLLPLGLNNITLAYKKGNVKIILQPSGKVRKSGSGGQIFAQLTATTHHDCCLT